MEYKTIGNEILVGSSKDKRALLLLKASAMPIDSLGERLRKDGDRETAYWSSINSKGKLLTLIGLGDSSMIDVSNWEALSIS